LDTLSISETAPGTSALTVASSSHAMLWNLPNTGWVGVAEFGSHHNPVILTKVIKRSVAVGDACTPHIPIATPPTISFRCHLILLTT
jgi:hypothetical protein